jgi:hypothetical protein
LPSRSARCPTLGATSPDAVLSDLLAAASAATWAANGVYVREPLKPTSL